MPLLVRPIRRPHPPFDAQTARFAVRLEPGGIDHHGLLFAVFGSQTDHHLGEDALIAPAFPTILERLVGTIFYRRF